MNEIYNSIAPKFRSRQAFVTAMEKARASILARGDRSRADDRVGIFLNANGNLIEHFIPALISFGDNSLCERYLSVSTCIKNNGWDLVIYRNTWLRLFIQYQLKFYNFKKISLESSVANVKGRLGLPVLFGDLIAMTAIFGDRELFENAVKFSLDCFDNDLVGGDITYLTQLFILQLSEKILDYAPRDWSISPSKEEPLFAELWKHWDDAETDLLESLLIQLLNRHTFQASRNNKDGGRDFEGHSEQYPMELHFIFRLREWRGLSNPAIKHRLTEPPFDVLPEPLQTIVFDEQTIQFVKKIREVFPDFDEVVNNAKIRDWKMLL